MVGEEGARITDGCDEELGVAVRDVEADHLYGGAGG